MEDVPRRSAEIGSEEQRGAEPEQRQPAYASREALGQPFARHGKQEARHQVDHIDVTAIVGGAIATRLR